MATPNFSDKSTTSQSPKLLDQVRDKLRVKHYSIRTEQTYVDWIRRYIFFHDKTHPKDLGAQDVEAFLTHLAVVGKVSASTQNQAKSALMATHLLQSSYDIRTVQDLLGHKNVQTTMIYTHVLNKGGRGVVSPLDR